MAEAAIEAPGADEPKGGADEGGDKLPEGINPHALPGSAEYMAYQDYLAAEKRKGPPKPKAKKEPEDAGDTSKAKNQPGTTEDEAAKAEAAKAAKAKEGGKGKGDDADNIMIPKARLDQVLGELRESRSEIDQLKGRLEQIGNREPEKPKEPEFDFNKANAEKWKAIKDGEYEKAQQLEALIDHEKAKIHAAEIENAGAGVQEAAQRTAQTQVAIQQVLSKYPELDKANESFNRDAFNYLYGKAQIAANAAEVDPKLNIVSELADAAEMTAMKFKLGDHGDKPESSEEELLAALGEKKTPAAIAAAQAAEKAKIAERQPADISKLGSGTDAPEAQLSSADIIKLSDKDIETMGEAKLRELRGDYLKTDAA